MTHHPLTPISLLLCNRLGPDYHTCAGWSVHVGLYHGAEYVDNDNSTRADMSIAVFYRDGSGLTGPIVAHFSGTVAEIEQQAAEWLSVGAALVEVGAVKEAA